MAHYFIGWEVGAWNCDGKNRQDAIAVLAADGGAVVPPIRTNVREIIIACRREELIRQFLRFCELDIPDALQVTLALSTPLGWPAPLVGLLTSRRTNEVPETADENPLLFRKTELALLEKGHRPLSVVRDMIGSQSTKGMHFVREAGFAQTVPGVWRVVSRETGSTYEAIETIPSILKRSPTFESAYQALPRIPLIAETLNAAEKAARADMERALRCALLASMFALAPSKLAGPPKRTPEGEGWIWIPTDAEPIRRAPGKSG